MDQAESRDDSGGARVNITYCDLAEFGLPLVTPADADFARLAEEIRNRSLPMRHLMDANPGGAAVVMNQSGKTVLSLAVVYTFTDADGQRSTNHFSGPFFGGGLPDVLTGAVTASPRTPGHIFHGSKRLITAQGVWGNNTDVIPPDPNDPRRGMAGGLAGSGFGGGGRPAAEPVSGELVLDLAIFEDGLCAGPDRSGGFDALKEELAERRRIGTQILEALETGASRGEIFDMVSPLAQGPPPPPVAARMPLARPLPSRSGHQFAHAVIHNLVQLEDAALRTMFANAARPTAIELRRP
jgi:hypothetical protein